MSSAKGQWTDIRATQLLAMSEYFRTCTPPRYKLSIKCVKACFKTPMTLELGAYAAYALGKLYFLYTKNLDIARHFVEKGYEFMKELNPAMVQLRIEAACILSEVCIQMKDYEPVKQVLKFESSFSRSYPKLHAWLLFLLAEVYGATGDWPTSSDIISVGISTFENFDTSLECFFRLTQAKIISMDLDRVEDVKNSIQKVGSKLVTLNDPSADFIKAYCFTIQICFFLSYGMLKSTKYCIRQLQSLVQTMKPVYENQAQLPDFDWLGREALTALAYTLTVMQSIQNCQLERAYKYHTIALRYINDMRRVMAKSDWPLVRGRAVEALAIFEMILFENIATAQLMVARPMDAITVIGVMKQKMSGNTDLFSCFEAQLHTLLGMYCWLAKCPEDAERQFKAALRTTRDNDLSTIINLSLAVIYLLTCRIPDFYSLFENITPVKLQASSPLLRASAHYVHALHSYLRSRLQEAKSHLTDSVTIVRDEGVPRIQALATLLSSKIVLAKAPDMLLAANSWAVKSADQTLILWSNHLIWELQLQVGQVDQAQLHGTKLKIDEVQSKLHENIVQAWENSAHSLIQPFSACRVHSVENEVDLKLRNAIAVLATVHPQAARIRAVLCLFRSFAYTRSFSV